MIKFFKDAISEIYNVTWPTKKHYMHISMVSIIFTLSTAVFIWFLDYFFDKWVKIVAPVAEIQSPIESDLDVSDIQVKAENWENADVEITEE